MKKILSLMVFVFSGTFLFAQSEHRQNTRDNTPQPVHDAFTKDHPEASNARWSHTNGKYQANYHNKDNKNVNDYYDQKGQHMYTRTEWDRKSMPADYDSHIRSKYHTTNYNVARIDRPNDKPLFELRLNLGGKAKTVYTDEQGNQVRFNK